jgi:hypothetical protein
MLTTNQNVYTKKWNSKKMNNRPRDSLIKAAPDECFLIRWGSDMDLIRLGLDGNEVPKQPVVLSLTLLGLWKMLGGIAALVGTAFTLGIYYQSDATKVQLDKKDLEIARLGATIDGLEKTCPVSRTKQSFFAVRSRLSLKMKEAASHPSDKKLQKELKDTKMQLATFLEENVNKKVDANGNAIISVAFDIKDSKDSKIQFRGEPETYEVPQDVKKLTRNITWNNPPQENAPGILNAVLGQQRDSAELSDDASNRKTCPLKDKSPLPTQRTRTLETREYYPAIIQPQP